MAEFQIIDADFASLKGQVIVITGGSSGIGLATTNLLLATGALVVVGDLSPYPARHPNLTFVHTDVTSWPSILSLFTTAISTHSRVDHLFANAGVGLRTNYLESRLDPATGALLEPSHLCLDINLTGCINTAYAGMHFMRAQKPPGGSVVCTASAAGFQRFGAPDYAATKHGVIGFVRGVTAQLARGEATGGSGESSGLRLNAVAPSWTISALLPREAAEGAGLLAQEAEVVARNVAVFMADDRRKGQVVYSVGGRYFEVEEAVLLPAAEAFVGKDSEDAGQWRYRDWLVERKREREGAE